MADLWNMCFDPAMGFSPDQFRTTFCQRCRNMECERSRLFGATWTQRMATQAERLLENPLFADPDDPAFAELRQLDFPSALREALRIEISDRTGDWTVPDERAISRAAAEMVTGHPVQDIPVQASPPDEPDLVVLRREEVVGSKGDIYVVTLASFGDGTTPPEWSCTCPAFQYGRARPCRHVLDIAATPEEAPEPPQAPPPQAMPAQFQGAGQRPFFPTMTNIPLPSGGIMLDGSSPPPPRAAQPPPQAPVADPWAPPPTKTDTVVPVGGTVVLGGGGKK